MPKTKNGLTIYASWRDFPRGEWRWPDFTPQEMACRGTGRLAIHPPSMDALQALRTSLGRPMVINSAYRSPEHNRHVGGARHSKHMEAIAYDVAMAGHAPNAFVAAARANGFRGIGRYARGAASFVHIDTRERPATWGAPFPPDPAQPSRPTPRVSRREDTPEAATASSGTVEADAPLREVAKDADKPLTKSTTTLGAIIAAGGPVLAALGDLDRVLGLALVAVGVAGAAYVIWERRRKAALAQAALSRTVQE